jgi:hypothetical protein
MEVDGVIRVYVCKCGNYYGASNMGKLQEDWNTDLKGERTTLRSTCPDCGSQRQERWAWLIPQDHVRDVLKEAGIKL